MPTNPIYSKSPLAGSPRKTLLTLVNNYPKDDPQLWRILKYIADLQVTLDAELNVLNEQASFSLRIPNIPLATGTDIAGYNPRIYLPRDINGNLVYAKMFLTTVGISVDPITATKLVADVQYSRDMGTTWSSLFKTTTTLVLPLAVQSIVYGNLAVRTLYEGDILRVDCTATGSSTTAEIYIAGQYSEVNNIT